MVLSLQEGDAVLADKKILVVDDDVRNIFALSSVLERYNMKVIAAHNGPRRDSAARADTGYRRWCCSTS